MGSEMGCRIQKTDTYLEHSIVKICLLYQKTPKNHQFSQLTPIVFDVSIKNLTIIDNLYGKETYSFEKNRPLPNY